jgi:hypothetical protein
VPTSTPTQGITQSSTSREQGITGNHWEAPEASAKHSMAIALRLAEPDLPEDDLSIESQLGTGIGPTTSRGQHASRALVMNSSRLTS